jgi:predicted metal-binding protein
MKKEKLDTTVEIFICNHSRDRDEDCASKGAKDLTDKLKNWAKEEHKGDIKVYRSGCLGKCSEGIAMTCYPSKELFLKINKDDGDEIKEGLKEALKKAKAQS